jgi:hypothetical protein
MEASLRIWILCVISAVILYYLYSQRREGFNAGLLVGVGTVQVASPNNLNTDMAATRVTACKELGILRKFYIDKITELRTAMDELSGTQVLAYNLKSENMKYQYEHSEQCTDYVNRKRLTGREQIPRNACIGFASQDDPLYGSILTGYDTVNLKLFQEEINIENNIQTINDTIAITRCDVSGFTFSADDIGTINTEELRAKLNELSPYYISPGTLDFVTTYLVGNGILDTALFTSSEILKSVNTSLGYIKTIADKQFP